MKSKALLTQIIKFVIVGGTATIIDFIIFFIMHEVCSISILISNVTSFTVSVIYNYIISIIWVFNTNKEANKKIQFIIFIIFSIIGLVINTGIVYLCTDVLKLYSMIGKVAATSIVMLYNFTTRKVFLEKKV